MKSWKSLICNIKQDFKSTKKAFFIFILCNVLIAAIYDVALSLIKVNNMMHYMVGIYSSSIVLSILYLIIEYQFQKKYSEIKNLNCVVNFRVFFLRVLKVYVPFVLISLCILVGSLLVLAVILNLLKVSSAISQLIIEVFIFVCIFAFFVFYFRLAFVENICLYKKIDARRKIIVRESINLLKKNSGVIIPLLILYVLLIFATAGLILYFKNGMSLLGIVIRILTKLAFIALNYFLVVITVNEVQTSHENYSIDYSSDNKLISSDL